MTSTDRRCCEAVETWELASGRGTAAEAARGRVLAQDWYLGKARNPLRAERADRAAKVAFSGEELEWLPAFDVVGQDHEVGEGLVRCLS